jgi:hypothetical protein
LAPICPEHGAALAGKVIQEMTIFDDESCGRQVVMRFTDGTEILIGLELKTIATVKLYRSSPGDMELLQEYREP